MRPILYLLAVLAYWVSSAPAAAHENLPIVVTFEERASGTFTIAQRLPGNIDPARQPVISLEKPCHSQAGSAAGAVFVCPEGHRPETLAFEWPDGMPSTSLLVRTRYLNGQEHSQIVPLPERSLALPETEFGMKVLGSYFVIGLEHILFGLDHLLFLACLVIIAGGVRRVAITVTGFTAGHALTITLASLGLVHVNGTAIEVLIALSIAFLAAEIVRGRRDTLTYRYPALVATVFGTLHGLGFAGALAEIGLAQTAIALSLVGFNLGVEAGQIVFVLAVFAAVGLWRQASGGRTIQDRASGRGALIAAYAVGTLSCYWVWERGLGLLS